MKLLKMNSSHQGKVEEIGIPKDSRQLQVCSGDKDKDSGLMKEFEIIKTLSKGKYSKVLLVKKKTEKMVLKAIRVDTISWEDFQQEVSTNYYLSPHPNILTSYNVSFTWNQSHIFVQEYAPFGDLGRYMKKKAPGGLKEEQQIKLIVKQVASALDFMHSSTQLVHGNICAENILLFPQDLSLVKLCDFGSTQPKGSLVVRSWGHGEPCLSSFLCPEITDTLPQEKYYVYSSSDVWSVGILLYFCLNGSSPWQTADITDSNYSGYLEWHKRKYLRMPESFKTFTPRLLRLLKRLLEPKPTKRCEIKEIFKYLKDDWIDKSCLLYSSKGFAGGRKDSYHSPTNNERILFQRHRSISTSPANTGRKVSQKHSRAKSLRVVKCSLGSRKTSDTTTDSTDESIFKRSVSYGK